MKLIYFCTDINTPNILHSSYLAVNLPVLLLHYLLPINDHSLKMLLKQKQEICLLRGAVTINVYFHLKNDY